MTAEKQKTKFGKFLQNVGKPVIRAAVKIGLPIFGTPIVELVTTVGQMIKGEKRKHTTISQAMQWILAGLVLADIVFNKGANILAIIDLIGLLPTEVPEVSPVP